MKIRRNKNIIVVNDVCAIKINDPDISAIQEEEILIILIIVMFINNVRID